MKKNIFFITLMCIIIFCCNEKNNNKNNDLIMKCDDISVKLLRYGHIKDLSNITDKSRDYIKFLHDSAYNFYKIEVINNTKDTISFRHADSIVLEYFHLRHEIKRNEWAPTFGYSTDISDEYIKINPSHRSALYILSPHDIDTLITSLNYHKNNNYLPVFLKTLC
jgi:hypothetical protein